MSDDVLFAAEDPPLEGMALAGGGNDDDGLSVSRMRLVRPLS